MMYAIPMYLYIVCNNETEAKQHKVQLEKMLANPMVKAALRSIPEKGFRVLDPQEVK
jgi:hypothetical protein